MPLQRASLTNTVTRERLFFQFAPATLREQIRPRFKRVLPVNGSRETSYYMGTESSKVPLQLFYSLIGSSGEGGDRAFPDLEQVEAAPVANSLAFEINDSQLRPSLAGPERFLKSLCYNDPDVSRAGLQGQFTTPLVVLDWPGVLALEGHIEDLDIGFEAFDSRDLRGLTLVADFVFVEDFEFDPVSEDERIRSSSVRVLGSNRADRKLIPQARRRDASRSPTTVRFTRELTG